MLTPEQRTDRALKAAATRKKRDPDSFKKMGKQGGQKGGRPFRDVPGLAKRASRSRTTTP